MLEIQNLSFDYHDAEETGVADVTTNVKAGECLVLAGRSGCGKSTLLRCLNGLAPRFFQGKRTGSVKIDGKEVADLEYHDLATLVGTVFQDPRSQFFSAEALSELCFVCENLGIPRKETQLRAEEAVSAIGITGLLSRTVFELSGGERQLLALASVRAARPRLYILDEPSANLDWEATRRLASVIGRLKDEGAALVIAEHKLWYLRDLVDQFMVIEAGQVVEEVSGVVVRNWRATDFAARGLRPLFPERGEDRRQEHQIQGLPVPSPGCCSPMNEATVISVKGIRKRRGKRLALKDVSTSIHSKELTVLIGPNGAGKSTFARILCGLDRSDGGKIMINGKGLGARELQKRGYYLMQDCDYQLFADSVENEIALGRGSLEERRRHRGFLLEELGLAPYSLRHPASLSRGQKQRLCSGCALMSEAPLIVLDEPTSGLDADSMASVGNLFMKVAARGAAVLAITHDYEFAACYGDRVIMMDDGRVIDTFALDTQGLDRLRNIFFADGTTGGFSSSGTTA